MTSTWRAEMRREPGQSRESWDAFQEWWRLQDETSTARIHMRQLERELREARKAVKAAEDAASAAMRTYEAVPFSEAVSA